MQIPPISLLADEKLLWMGTSQKPAVTSMDVGASLLPGVVLLYLWGHLVAGLPLPLVLPAEVAGFMQSGHWLLLLFGVGLLLKPFVVNLVLKRTIYVFTNMRAVAYSSASREITLEVPAAEIPAMRVVKHSHARVSLGKWDVQENSEGQAVNVRTGFDYIPAEVPEYYTAGQR